MFLVKDKEIDTMGTVNDFSEWLKKELDKRDWQPYTLGQKADLGNSTVSRILAGSRNPGFDVCLAIAKALDERPEKVLRLAGLLPPSFGELSDLDEKEGKLLRLFRAVPDHQDSIIDILEGLHSTHYGNGSK